MAKRQDTGANSNKADPKGWLVGTDLSNRLRRLVAGLPGAAYAEDQLHQAEDAVLRELKARLDRLEPTRASVKSTSVSSNDGYDGQPAVVAETAGETMTRLLAESTAQKKAGAENAVYARLLASLLPDEARIVAALSDGEPHAVVHAGHGARVGPISHRIASNLSAIGRTAQVRALDHVPHYIEHLSTLGLVRIGPGMRELAMKYQIIENDKPIRELVAEVHQESGKNVRFSRHSLRISTLGQQLWDACQSELSGDALGWSDE